MKMWQRCITGLAAVLLVFGLLAGGANASLVTIGTADYAGGTYKLIYDDNGPFGPIAWLDYTKSGDRWADQVAWAAGLNTSGVLIYDIDPAYTSIWATLDGDWRLLAVDESQANPSGGFGYQGPDGSGYHDYGWGYNMVNSEMGHLYYTELGNLGYYAPDGTNPQPGWSLHNTGPFDNLIAAGYWSGTEYADLPANAWIFGTYGGNQLGRTKDSSYNYYYALAVRPGQVAPVPLPPGVLLLGSGLAGLVGLRRRRRDR